MSSSIQMAPEIDKAYSTLTTQLLQHADKSLPKKRYKSHLKPYWNDGLSQLHREMRQLRSIWCTVGRPRDNDVNNTTYVNYKAAKARFRRLHREAVSEYMTKLDSEIDHTAELDSYRFWKMVKSRRKGSRDNLGSGIRFDEKTLETDNKLPTTGAYTLNVCTPLL